MSFLPPLVETLGSWKFRPNVYWNRLEPVEPPSWYISICRTNQIKNSTTTTTMARFKFTLRSGFSGATRRRLREDHSTWGKDGGDGNDTTPSSNRRRTRSTSVINKNMIAINTDVSTGLQFNMKFIKPLTMKFYLIRPSPTKRCKNPFFNAKIALCISEQYLSSPTQLHFLYQKEYS